MFKLKKKAMTAEYKFGKWFFLGLPAHTQTALSFVEVFGDLRFL